MDIKDLLMIAGGVIGIILGGLVGKVSIYSAIVNSNYNGETDERQKLDASTRFNIGFVGGLFFIIGVAIAVAILFFVEVRPEEKGGLLVFSLFAAFIGGLLLWTGITGNGSSN